MTKTKEKVSQSPEASGGVKGTTPTTPNPEQENKIALGMVNVLATYRPEENIKKTLTPSQVSEVIEKIARNKEIANETALRAVATLIRKGAANAKAKDTMTIEIICTTTKVATELSRYDMGMALYAVAKHKVIRKLAEAMAPMMLEANLQIIKRVPTADLKGDLANKINRRLLDQIRKTPADKTPPSLLTMEEEICCCTYAQWMPNLDQLANSTRLKRLLEEDLLLRTSKPKKKAVKPAPKEKGHPPSPKKK